MKPILTNISLLLLRVFAGGMMALNHGWGKLSNFSENKEDFYDWLGLGDTFSLVLAIFGEFFCGLFLVLGLAARLAAIPMIITMCVIIFGVHWGDPFKKVELPVIYLTAYVVVALMGPGEYSLDRLVLKRLV